MYKIIIVVICVFNVFVIKAQIGIKKIEPSSSLDVNGSVQTKLITLNKTGVIPEDSQIIHAYNSNSVIVLTLPNLTSTKAGRVYTIKNTNLTSQPNISVRAPGIDNSIDLLGELVQSFTLRPGEAVQIVKTNNIGSRSWTITSSTLHGVEKNIYTSDGEINEMRRVNIKGNNALNFSSEAQSGSSHFVVKKSNDTPTLNIDVVKANLGINNSVPAASLDVSGNLKAIGLDIGSNINTDSPLVIDNNGFFKKGKFSSIVYDNIYNKDGTIQSNRTVNQGANTLNFISSATSGTSHFSVVDNTLNIDAVNHRLGIGSNAPAAKLEVNGNMIVKDIKYSTNAGDSPLVIDSNGEVKKISKLSGTYFLGGTVYVRFQSMNATGIPTNRLIGGAPGVTYTVGDKTEKSNNGGLEVLKGNGYKISNPSAGIFDIFFETPYNQIFGITVNILDSYGQVYTGGIPSGANSQVNSVGTGLKVDDGVQVSFISNNIVRIKTGDHYGSLSNRSFAFLITGR